MWAFFLLDFIYLTSDFMTGQTIPAFFAVTAFTIDPYLLGSMVLLGAAIGMAINLYKTLRPSRYILLDWALRLVNLSFSILCSVILAKRIMHNLHPDMGWFLGAMPLFWVSIHYIQRRKTTPNLLFIMFFVSLFLFYLSILIHPDMLIDSSYVQEHQRQLASVKAENFKINANHPIQTDLPQGLYIMIATAYACTHHGSFFFFTGRYHSASLIFHKLYSVLICFLSALFRAYIITTIGWLQNNLVHLIIEGNTSDSKYFLALYLIVLNLSLAWNVAQTSYQILTVIQGDHEDMKVKYLLLMFIAACFYQWTGLLQVLRAVAGAQVVLLTLAVLII